MTNLSSITQAVIPDFFSGDFHQKAYKALERVDGMTLSNFLGGRVFHDMVRDIFQEELSSRSESLAEEVREYMQGVLCALCEHACVHHPDSLKTKIMDAMKDLFLDT